MDSQCTYQSDLTTVFEERAFRVPQPLSNALRMVTLLTSHGLFAVLRLGSGGVVVERSTPQHVCQANMRLCYLNKPNESECAGCSQEKSRDPGEEGGARQGHVLPLSRMLNKHARAEISTVRGLHSLYGKLGENLP